MTEIKRSTSGSSFSEFDDPELLEALATAVLPGDSPADSNQNKKRKQWDSDTSNSTYSRSKRLRFEDSEPTDERTKNSDQSPGTPCLSHQTPDRDDAEQQKHKASQSSSFDVRNSDSARIAEAHGNPLTSLVQPPLSTTDPISFADASRVPGYSPFISNASAERAMQSAEFRASNTSAAGSAFIDGYYKNSRLHHLSTWKTELKALVSEAQQHAEEAFAQDGRIVEEHKAWETKSKPTSGLSMLGSVLPSPAKEKRRQNAHVVEGEVVDTDRVIMHCDFDCFFASVGLLDRPHLKDKPVVVCHSQTDNTSSTSEVSSCNYEARKYGISNGTRQVLSCRPACDEYL